MYTYDVVSESIKNPHQLAEELTRRSRDGWEVVNVVFDGEHWFHAFLRHAGSVSTAPFPTASPSAGAVATAAPSTAPAADGSVPQVPANWYKDPSGRYELRYWNGTQWTEHVATGGRQSVDPPKA